MERQGRRGRGHRAQGKGDGGGGGKGGCAQESARATGSGPVGKNRREQGTRGTGTSVKEGRGNEGSTSASLGR